MNDKPGVEFTHPWRLAAVVAAVWTIIAVVWFAAK